MEESSVGKDDIPYMKWKISNVPNHQPDDVPMNTWLFGNLRNTIHAQGPFSKSVRIIPNGPAKTTNPEKLSRIIEQQRLI